VKHSWLLSIIVILILFILSACSSQPITPTPEPPNHPTPTTVQSLPTPTPPTPTPEPDPRVLNVCMGQEPSSLFIYGDNSRAAASIREAIYDGPFDVHSFEYHPVILELIPDFENEGAWLEPVTIYPGDLLIDSVGNYAALREGIKFFPSGCSDETCLRTYQGSEAIAVDRLAVRFKIRPGLTWSDGIPLTASDSVFSFQTAKSLFPAYRPGLIDRTAAYEAIDETTIEWRGVPGYRDPRYFTNFFHPLPEHTLSQLPIEEIASSESAARAPLSWGPYKIEKWSQGDNLTLRKNPLYFRAGEGLPHFDILVYRFMDSPEDALDALLAGECDLADRTVNIPYQSPRLAESVASGLLSSHTVPGIAVELALFGISPADSRTNSLFQPLAVRQAVALCLDRESIIRELSSPDYPVPYSYLLPAHPLFNQEVEQHTRDVDRAGELLASAGWIDHDGSPDTPRVSRGAAGFFYDMPFTFSYLTTSDPARQRTAEILKVSLGECGIGVEIQTLDTVELLASGPEGPVFGRNFDMAQIGWRTSLEPHCMLYHSSEIPGYYPEFSRGWGGANASGFNDMAFDEACVAALTSPPGSLERQEAHSQAQAIFSKQLPVIPLYYHTEVVVSRSDLCGIKVDPSANSALWNIEEIDYDESCQSE
jgi:peptide/nickel transport system substrate-binding protein